MALTALVASGRGAGKGRKGGTMVVPIVTVTQDRLESWRASQPARVRAWLDASGFRARPGERCLLAGAAGGLETVYLGLPGAEAVGPVDDGALWAFAGCATGLPPGTYALGGRPSAALSDQAALGWALGSYQFTRYRKAAQLPACLVWPERADRAAVESAALATYLVRDLVNTPAGDMGPPELAAAARAMAKPFGADVRVITGAQLLKRNYPAIHAVGRAADKAPRLIDLRWAPRGRSARLPRVTICGKGVCFDSGGLDLKSAAGMLHMKKDMGGAAQALGLARMIMAAKLPVRLRVLIPAVENSVSGNAYRPRDVVTTRKGLTVEIGNTDAEGRVVLADALAAACEEGCDLLIDLATLTGAARVALGTSLPALFSNDDHLADQFARAATVVADPVWRLPLWQPYREKLDSKVADINNVSPGSYGGAITAALFLQEFVTPGTPWIHLYFMAWNEAARPGRPEGGEAQGMRALFELIRRHYTG